MSLGSVMIDLAGTGIDAQEKELLQHPQTGGVILFTRNFESVEQIHSVIEQIHALRDPHLLVAIDHEGGRVQRFHDGFTRLPPAAVFGRMFDEDPDRARRAITETGWLLAAELRAIGVDFSFAPVLDLAHGVSGVIGDRALHARANTVVTLAYAFMQGLEQGGMRSVGKHFPGHGGVAEDSHLALPHDDRDLAVIEQQDMHVFERMIINGIPAIMPAHVIFDTVDHRPAGYSKIWLQDILRQRLGFQGVIFSDDLSMEAAGVAGGYAERAQAALEAGCDMVLVCNHTEGAAEVLTSLEGYNNPVSQLRLIRMHGKGGMPFDALHRDERWQRVSRFIAGLDESPWLEMEI